MEQHKTQEEREVEEFLAQFDAMSPEDRRRAMATVFGVDPAKAAIVRRPDGKLEMREVSAEARAQIERLGRQGFAAVSFTNRKQKRREAALARRSNKSRSASAR